MQAEIDICILEVGLGGRLDAVNVFEPDCSIVTTIDIDHTDFLGHSRDSIGFEKAGIFRPNTPAICGDLSPPVTLINHAVAIGAELKRLGDDFTIHAHDGKWDFVGANTIEGLPYPALTGDFQLHNAACALAAIEVMQAVLPIVRTDMDSGLNSVRLAGRFQTVGKAPTVILDVAHNPHAAVALAENLHHAQISGKTIAVFAMLADKDMEGVIAALISEIDDWYLSSIAHARGADTSELVEIFNKTSANQKIRTFNSLADAFQQACLDASKNDRIIVFGSFFTVAEVMRVLPEPIYQ